MPVPPIATARHFARGKLCFLEKLSAVTVKCLSSGATHPKSPSFVFVARRAASDIRHAATQAALGPD
eukprot:3304544-Prymnesium_polylepis.1